MFDIGWAEMGVIALVALVVIGPKQLPGALRTLGRYTRKLKSMAREFQSGMDQAIREAELDDAKDMIGAARKLNPKRALRDAIDKDGTLEAAGKEVEDLAKDRKVGATAKEKDVARAKKAAALKSKTKAAPEDVDPTGPAASPASQGGEEGDEPQEFEVGAEAAKPKATSAPSNAAQDGEKAMRASIVETPLRMAPGNSIKPPVEDPEKV